VVVDRQGVPLALILTAANVHDSRVFERLVDAIPPIPGPRGRPRTRPTKLHADKGYDYARCRTACRARGIVPRIARRGIESRTRLGRYRWVVERTLAWFNRYRRLRIRDERRRDMHEAFLTLGCALICWKYVTRFC
jgi:IS5 family transposase